MKSSNCLIKCIFQMLDRKTSKKFAASSLTKSLLLLNDSKENVVCPWWNAASSLFLITSLLPSLCTLSEEGRINHIDNHQNILGCNFTRSKPFSWWSTKNRSFRILWPCRSSTRRIAMPTVFCMWSTLASRHLEPIEIASYIALKATSSSWTVRV